MEKRRRAHEARDEERKEQEKKRCEEDDDEWVPEVANVEAGGSYFQTTDPRDEIEKIVIGVLEEGKNTWWRVLVPDQRDQRKGQRQRRT